VVTLSYTPDILIQKESVLKAFKEAFNGLLPDDYNIKKEAKEKARKSVLRKKEFRGLSKLKKQKEVIEKEVSKPIDNIRELSSDEFNLIVKNRLKDNDKYQQIAKRIKEMEYSIQEHIEFHPDYIIWQELKDIYQCDSTVMIEGKEYYWKIVDLSSVAHALCDWLEEHNVVHVTSYSR